MLSMIFVMVTMAVRVCAAASVEVLDEPSPLHRRCPSRPVTEVADGSIDFDHVSFKYSARAERQALADVDLHVRSGETIGIIGGTGSSKSTLVNLVARLYDATEGRVRVGGVDVRDYDLEALRTNVAMVLQKNVLFTGTIAENLRWGDENATDDAGRARQRTLPAPTSSSMASPRATTPTSSRAAPTFPAGRSSASASPARSCATPKVLDPGRLHQRRRHHDRCARFARAWRRTFPRPRRSSSPSASPRCRTRTASW